jgi:hypothetical protein
MDSEYVMAMMERMQILEDAVNRAEAGQACSEDWDVIRRECGVSKQGNLTLINGSESWV